MREVILQLSLHPVIEAIFLTPFFWFLVAPAITWAAVERFLK